MVQVAATAKATHSQNVIDAVLTTLLQFTRVADPSQPYAHAVVAFGSSALARDATVTLFDIAADYADLMRTGWATCLDCLLRLHKCRLVEPAIFTDAQVRPHVPCPALTYISQRISRGEVRQPLPGACQCAFATDAPSVSCPVANRQTWTFYA